MLKIYKTENDVVSEVKEIENGTWINLTNPSNEEIKRVSETLGINDDFLRAALDDEESSRTEVDDMQTLVIIDIPTAESDRDSEMYSTIPMGIVITPDNIVTVCLKDCSMIRDIASGRIKNINTRHKTRFILKLLLLVAGRYLVYLRKISRISSRVERQLYESLKNEELIELLGLEKSLVYFSTSLKADEVTLQRIHLGKVIKLYEEDKELLEDVLIEIHQAIEMANIYSSILSGTMDAFASVISNNLNIIMKVLTVITILMTIPNIVFSFYGMNVGDLPLPLFWVPIVISVAAMLITWSVLKKKKLY